MCYNYLRKLIFKLTVFLKEIKMLGRIYQYLIEAQEKKVAYWQLQNMSDKALKDMGITRGEIYQKIYGE